MVPMPNLVFGHRRKGSQGSLDLSTSMASLERRLTEQTDLIDEMKKVLPMTVAAPGIIAIGGAGAGKSTILEAITNVPLARGTGGIRRPIRLKIVSDPTCAKCVGHDDSVDGGSE
jgi:predicted ATPase